MALAARGRLGLASAAGRQITPAMVFGTARLLVGQAGIVSRARAWLAGAGGGVFGPRDVLRRLARRSPAASACGRSAASSPRDRTALDDRARCPFGAAIFGQMTVEDADPGADRRRLGQAVRQRAGRPGHDPPEPRRRETGRDPRLLGAPAELRQHRGRDSVGHPRTRRARRRAATALRDSRDRRVHAGGRARRLQASCRATTIVRDGASRRSPKTLARTSFVLRRRTDVTDGGLPGKEGGS